MLSWCKTNVKLWKTMSKATWKDCAQKSEMNILKMWLLINSPKMCENVVSPLLHLLLRICFDPCVDNEIENYFCASNRKWLKQKSTTKIKSLRACLLCWCKMLILDKWHLLFSCWLHPLTLCAESINQWKCLKILLFSRYRPHNRSRSGHSSSNDVQSSQGVGFVVPLSGGSSGSTSSSEFASSSVCTPSNHFYFYRRFLFS